MTATLIGGLVGFEKYGDPDSISETGATVIPFRESPTNSTTTMLSREQMQMRRLAELGNVLTSEKAQSLREFVRNAYQDEVQARQRPLSPELLRELADFVASINFYEAGAHVNEGSKLLIPYLDTFVAAVNAYQELARPNHLAWLPRVSEELSQFGYLIARETLVVPDEQIGYTTVAQRGAQWEQIIKAHYPELARYPKTRAHLIQGIAEAHGASAEHGPEEGRRLFLPNLKSLLQGNSDPKSLLHVEPAAVVGRAHPELARVIALEKHVWDRFLSPEKSSGDGSKES
jgi:hypothetical protein